MGSVCLVVSAVDSFDRYDGIWFDSKGVDGRIDLHII